MQFLFGNRRHVFQVALPKLLPTDLSIIVYIDLLEFLLKFVKTLSFDQIVRDKRNNCRLKLIDFGKLFHGLHFIGYVQVFVALFGRRSYPWADKGLPS